MTDHEALLKAAALLSCYKPLLGQREDYDAVMKHAKPHVIERNRWLFT
jgi:hypothetical protein